MTRVLSLLAIAAVSVSAQDWARQKLEQSPRHREWVTVKHDGSAVETLVVYPESKGKTPVYGFYGGNDARIDATIQDAEKNMKALGKTYEPVVYEGAGHGFMRAGEAPDATEANRKAREESWERLKKILKG